MRPNVVLMAYGSFYFFLLKFNFEFTDAHFGSKVMRISRQPSPVTIMIGQKQLDNVECFNYLGSMLTNDGRCTREIKSRIAMAKVAFNKKKFITLLTSTRHIFIYLPNVKFLYEIFRLYLMPVHILALLGMLPY